MEDIRITVVSTIGDVFCVAAEDGQKVFELISGALNPDYALGFVMRLVIAIKSGCLETES